MEGEFKNVNSQSLECPVCLGMFTEPKILACSHTFCNACLEHLRKCHSDDQKLICPVCRGETRLHGQDVSQLQTNLALRALVEDVKTQHQCCTNCKSDEKPRAVVYCQDCGKYFCITCQTKHSQWEDFSDHDVSTMSDVTSGKVSVRRYRKCRKHPKEDEECFCSHCRIFVCFRCSIMTHVTQGHKIIEQSVYEEDHNKKVEELKGRADAKNGIYQKYIDFIDEQKTSIRNSKDKCMVGISTSYDESVRHLTEKRDRLFDEVQTKTQQADATLDRMKELIQQQITQLASMTELLTNGTKIPLEINALAVHDTLCKELEDTLSREDPDYEEVRMSSEEGRAVRFQKSSRNSELCLGKMIKKGVKDIELPTKDSMDCIENMPDGRLAVGCFTGGIEVFSHDGHLQQTELKDVRVRGLGFLSDGRRIVLDENNKALLYTSAFEKLNFELGTISDAEGGYVSVSVDNDQIYVSYRDAQKIHVFSCVGGEAIKEIPCDGYVPMQITKLNDGLLIKYSDTVIIIDDDGRVKRKVTKQARYPYPCLTSRNLVLIAWVQHNDGLVSIDEYTSELDHVTNLVTDYKIEKPERDWYFMREFGTGEVAFCTPDRLYIFNL